MSTVLNRSFPPFPLGAAVVAAAALAAYAAGSSGAWVYDDFAAVVDNPSIRTLGWAAWSPPPGITTSGRPLVNLSFALNHAWGGFDVTGYHVVNAWIHAASGLALFGLLRTAFRRPVLAERLQGGGDGLALLVSLAWVLHPLQSEAVSYVSQRVESLMGLLYLVTLYAWARSLEPAASGWWRAGAFAACAAGMACKEVMASAPLLALLYDRALVAGGFRPAWRERKRGYLTLAATWLLLAALVGSTGWNRGGTVGVGLGVGWWDYALTQFRAVVVYLRLSGWPFPLVFDYGTLREPGLGAVLPQAFVVAVLLAGSAWLLWRRPSAGLLAAGFLAPLAPTSLLPGTTQMIVEHRMYLPLASVLIGVGWLGWRLLGRAALPALGAAAVAFGGLTVRRQADYHDGLTVWADTVRKAPANARAYCNLGIVLAGAGRLDEAVAAYGTSLRLAPNSATTRYNHGVALGRLGRVGEAAAEYRQALRLVPDHVEARCNLGALLLGAGRPAEAGRELEEALALRPGDADVLTNLGQALALQGKVGEALPRFLAAISLRPDDPDARFNAALALMALGRRGEAMVQFESAVRLRPDDPGFRRELDRVRSEVRPTP